MLWDIPASYWNPAAYGFFKEKEGDISEKRDWSTFLGAGVGAQIHEDLGEEISKILEFDYDTLDNGVVPANKVADFLQLVNELKTFDDNESRAITVTANGRLGIQKGHWGLAGYAFGDLSARGDLDLINIAPVSAGATFTIDEFTAPANYGYAGTPDTYTYYDQSGNPASSDLITYLTTTLGWTQNQAEDFTDITDYGLTQANAEGIPIPDDILTQTQHCPVKKLHRLTMVKKM